MIFSTSAAIASVNATSPMGMAPVAHVLWNKFMRFNPKNPKWLNRDRFILSAGHGSMFLYGWLHLSGYALSMEEISPALALAPALDRPVSTGACSS